jgi:hypothetical protein
MNRLLAVLVLSCLTAGAAQAAPEEADDTKELLAIMKETESPDTFLITLKLVVERTPDAPGLLPTVIRNAERLGITKGMASGKLTKEQEMFAEVLEDLAEAKKTKAAPAAWAVSAGHGLRVVLPTLGPAPIALDTGFPVKKPDEKQHFSFWLGLFH